MCSKSIIHLNIQFDSNHLCWHLLSLRQASLGPYKIQVHKIRMQEYENHHYDKDQLKDMALTLGEIEVDPASDLEQVRKQVVRMCEENHAAPTISPDWCFVDSEHICTCFLLSSFLNMCTTHFLF
jgi:hypothetical protein